MIVLSAGMPRAASTWLFNAARLLLTSQPFITERNFSYGWVGDLPNIPARKNMLLKIHDYHPQLVAQSAIILYSYRDLRDTMASFERHFGREPQLSDADHLVRQYELWTQVAHFVMQYETMRQDRESTLIQMAQALRVPLADPAALVNELDAMRYESPGSKTAGFHRTNLFHPQHITDGRHGSWKGQLDPKLVKAIETRYGEWLAKHGYAIG